MLVDVAELTRRHLGDGGDATYASTLAAAFDAAPPVYGLARFAKQYRCRASDRSWFASLLVSDCDLEGYSARQLSRYASEVTDPRFAMGLAAHAADEARHSRIFASLLIGVFPQLGTDHALRDRLSAMSPRLKVGHYGSTQQFSAVDESLLSTAVLINLHEVKALVLEYLLRPMALAHAPERNRQKIARQLDVLIGDEVQHVRYSADYIRHAAANGWTAQIVEMMREYQILMNEVTAGELDETSLEEQVAEMVS